MMVRRAAVLIVALRLFSCLVAAIDVWQTYALYMGYVTSSTVEVGAEAPNFTLNAVVGDPVTLSELRGNPVVLVFLRGFF